MGSWGFSDLLQTLDSRPGVRFREFERICRWYLLNAPKYRSRVRQVWLWSDWPEAWGRDAGIDLIAKERDGGYGLSRRSSTTRRMQSRRPTLTRS
jgi:predicted helicase